MLITVVNPNTSWDMTGMIELTARAVAGPDTTIRAVSPAMGPASIESHYDEALAVPGVLAEVESEVNDPGLFVPQVGLVIALKQLWPDHELPGYYRSKRPKSSP